ncbi:MAG: hypothetical protein ACK6DT_12185 [Planctomycetota bacterium]
MKKHIIGVFLAAACPSHALNGVSEPGRLSALIAVPAIQHSAAEQITDRGGKKVWVSFVDGDVKLGCRASQHLFEGMWGAYWSMSEFDRIKVRKAVVEHGEAWLVYDRRALYWWFEDRVAVQGVVDIQVASRDDAIDLAHRISSGLPLPAPN